MAQFSIQHASEIVDGPSYVIHAYHLLDNFNAIISDFSDRMSLTDPTLQTVASAVTFLSGVSIASTLSVSNSATFQAGLSVNAANGISSLTGNYVRIAAHGVSILGSNTVPGSSGQFAHEISSHRLMTTGITDQPSGKYFLMDVDAQTLGAVSTQWILPVQIQAKTTASLAANTIRYVPIFIKPNLTANSLGFELTSAGSANVRLGIYANLNSRPYTLIQDGGSQAVSATGVYNFTIPGTYGGWYWLAIVSSASITIRMIGQSAAILGTDATTSFSSEIAGYAQSFTFGALPSLAASLSAIGTPVPLLAIR